MWPALFLLYLGTIYFTNAQNLANADAQTDRDELQANKVVEFYDTRQPIIFSIRDGQPDKEYNSQDAVSGDDQALFYSNQWKPLVVTNDFNQLIDRGGYQTESDNKLFLRRPDSELNKKETYGTDGNEQLTSIQLPSAAIFLYPNPENSHPVNNEEGNTVVTNSSTSATLLSLSDSATSSPEQNRSEIFPSENVFNSHEGLEITDPLDVYRDTQELTPASVPVYVPPYPIFPFAILQSFRPTLGSSVDRDSSSETPTNTSVINGFSEVESHSMSDYIHVNEAVLKENIPSETPPDIVPLPRLNPFVSSLVSGILPFKGESFIPFGSITSGRSFILSATSRGLTVRPSSFAESKNSQTANNLEDTLLPLTVERYPLEPTISVPQLDATPQTEVLQPQQEISTYIKNESQNSLQEDLTTESIMPYEFGYDMNDGHGTDQHRKESLDRFGVVTGSYGYRDMFGVYRLVKYIADKGGFRASINSNEPGVASTGSADVEIIPERPTPNLIFPESTNVAETDGAADEALVNPGIENESK